MSKEANVNSKKGQTRNLVLPGDLLDTQSKPGKGIFRRQGRIHASVLGFSNDKSGYVNVNAVTG